MTIDVSTLPKGGAVAVSVVGELNVSTDYNLLNTFVPVNFLGRLSHVGETYILEGELNADAVSFSCDKCLKPVEIPITAKVFEKFSREVALPGQGQGDEEIWQFTGKEIDVTQALLTNFLLALPLQTLCDDDCKGLCPVCGKDLNLGECGCVKPVIDPRFAGLMSLFQDKEV